MVKGLLAVSIALVGAAALAVTAFAGDSVKSKVTVSNAIEGQYIGEVTSEDPKCLKRKIYVFHDENNNGVDDSDFEIGRTKTSSDGGYLMTGKPQAPSGDHVIAVATKRKKGSVVCKRTEGDTTALSD
jgi:hypothetical protein